MASKQVHKQKYTQKEGNEEKMQEENNSKSSSDESSDDSIDDIGQLETSDESEQEAEDNFGTFEPKKWHEEFLELLPKLAGGEKVEKKFFEGELVIPKAEDEKKIKLGDYIRERVLDVEKTGGEANVFEEEEQPKKETVVEEQGRLLKEFHEKANEMSEDDDLLITKRKADPICVEEELNHLEDKARDFWTKAENPDDEFLKKYILEKKWEELEDGKEQIDLDEDQKAVDAQDDFEAEQRLGIVSYGRTVKDTLRKEHKKRKEQRERRKEKKKEEKRKMNSAISEQKKEQKKKIEERVKELQKESGVVFDQKFMEEEFDESKYDEMMQKQFGDDFYEKEDDFQDIDTLRAEIAGEMNTEKLDMDENEQDHFDQEEYYPEAYSEGVTEKAEKKKSKKDKKDCVVLDSTDGTKEHVDIEKLRGKDEKLDKMIDEYYGLDFEDVIDGQKTRFEYINVDKDDSGLTAYDILCLSDKELNKMLSIKRLAPYDNRKLTKGEKERVRKMKEMLYEDNGENESKKPRFNNKEFKKPQKKFNENRKKGFISKDKKFGKGGNSVNKKQGASDKKFAKKSTN